MAPVPFQRFFERFRQNRLLALATLTVLIMMAVAVGAAAATGGKTDSEPPRALSPVTEPDFEPASQLSPDELYLIARVIEGEAATEPYRGRVAVGAVIMNRVKHEDFPDSVHEVVFQPRAFCVVANGLINRTPSEESIRAARAAANGHDPTGGALYFWNPNKRTNSWIWTRTPLVTIGNHMFGH